MPGRTLFEKIWTQHVVAELSSDLSLLTIDRHFLHDLEAGPNFTDWQSSATACTIPT